jgi:fumarate reductase flavoprotein subunit
MADYIGADPGVLKATIEEYNYFCDHGHDEVFAKEQRYLLPLRKAPYYALKCFPSFHDTMGGIKVSEHMEVRDTWDNIIPGLYAAGVLPDGWETDDYCWVLCGSAFGFAINSGRIAGENAARYVKGK